MDFVETGQFEFTLEGQNCRATMRRTRTYSLVEREGESRSAPAVPMPAAEPSFVPVNRTATPSDQKMEERLGLNCVNPGPAARVEVRPTRKLLRAGDEYSFNVRVVDRAGCPLERPLSWRVLESNTTLEVSTAGVVRVAKEAAEGSATLSASVQDRAVQVTVDVVSERRYQDLLAAGQFDDRGETRDAAVATIASASVGAKASVLEEKARVRRLVFVSVIGVLALGLAGTALWMMRGRRRTRSEDSVSRGEGEPVDARGELLICPVCQKQYPASTRYCAVDGEPLVPLPADGPPEELEGGICPVCGQGFDPGITVCPTHEEELVPRHGVGPRPVAPAAAQRRICPVCGTVYGTEHQFCGNDGATLVPIN